MGKGGSVEYLVVITCLAVLWMGWRSRRQTMTLAHFEALPDDELPGLSVVIAARDEARVVQLSLIHI